MTHHLMLLLILVLSFLCIGMMIFQLQSQPKLRLQPIETFKLAVSGVVAFISDTIGVGSFSVNVMMAKVLGTFRDEELPAVNNGAQVLPGMIESLFFMQMVDVDATMMITLVAGTCIGGVLGGSIVSRLSKQAIRLAMMCCFTLIILLLTARQLHLLPAGGEVMVLSNWKLIVGFFAMMICGLLTAVGVGLFALVQAVLFLLNVSPIVAFPIMTTAGALQQPLTTLVFLKNGKIPLKKTMILSVFGCVGVFMVLPIVAKLPTTWLHTLLLAILIYNLYAMSRAFLQTRFAQLSPAAVSTTL